MSEEKRETREALLGELESIKDLLSDDEWDEIPVLSDTIASPTNAETNEDSSSHDTSESATIPTLSSDLPDASIQSDHQLDLMSTMNDEPSAPIEAEPSADNQKTSAENKEPSANNEEEPLAPSTETTNDTSASEEEFSLALDALSDDTAESPSEAIPELDTELESASVEQPSSAVEPTTENPAAYQSDIDAAVDKLNLDLNLSDDSLTEDDLEQLEIGELVDSAPVDETLAQPATATETAQPEAFDYQNDQQFPDEGTDLNNQKPDDNLEEQLEHDLEELTHELDAFDEALAPDIHESTENHEDANEAISQEAVDEESSEEESIREQRAEFQHDAFGHLTPAIEPSEDSTAIDPTISTTETDDSSNLDASLPPGVLPGQQSLFSGGSKSENTRPHRSAKPTGENPFLPKHIRDRLHTNKALVDIIKESPLPPPQAAKPLSEHIHESVKEKLPLEIPAERLHDMVEEIIALYMPRIEAELRERLLQEVKEIEPDSEEG